MLRKASTTFTSSIETELPVLPFLAPRTIQLSQLSLRSSIDNNASLPRTRKRRQSLCLAEPAYHQPIIYYQSLQRTGTHQRTRPLCAPKQNVRTNREKLKNRVAVNVRKPQRRDSPCLQNYASSLEAREKIRFHCCNPGLLGRTRSPGFARLTRKSYATEATSHKYVPVPVKTYEECTTQTIQSGDNKVREHSPHSKAVQHLGDHDKTETLKQIKDLIGKDTMTVAHIPGAIPYDFNPHISQRQPPSRERSVYIKGEVIPKKKGRHVIHSKLWSAHNIPKHRGQIWPTSQNHSALNWFVDSKSGDLRCESVPLFWAKAMSVLIVREDWRHPDWMKKEKVTHHSSVDEWLGDLKKYGQDVASIRQAYSEWNIKEREERLAHVMLKVMDETPDTILCMLQAACTESVLDRYLVGNSLQLFVEQNLEKEPKFAKNITHPIVDEILDTIDMLDESAKTLSQKTLYLLISRSDAQQLLRLNNIVERLRIFCHGHTYLFLAYASSLHGRPRAAVRAVLNACETGVGKAADSLQSVCCSILCQAKIRDDKYEDIVGWMSQILSSGIPLGPYLFDTIIDTVAIKGDLRHAMFLVKQFEKTRKSRLLYSAYASLLSGCETCPDGEVVDEVLEMVVESELAMSYPKVATQLLYVNYLYHFQQRDGRFFDAMLRVFRRFYSLEPLLDLGLVTRGEAELTQPVEQMKLLPSGFVMSIMIMAWLRTKPCGAMNDIEVVYNKFRNLVENGHHIIGRLTERDYVYRAFITAFGRQHGGLVKCADVVRDMDRPLPSTAYWRAASRPLVQIKPTVGTWNVLAEAFLKNGEESAALLILDEMRKRDLQPTIDTYNKFLRGYAHLQNFGGIKFILSQMCSDGIELNNESIERLAKLRDQRRLVMVLSKVEYNSLDEVEITDTDDSSPQHLDDTNEKNETTFDQNLDTTPKYEELPKAPRSLSYEEWLAKRPKRPERPERVSSMWPSWSSPQWSMQSDEDQSESYRQEEIHNSEVAVPARHQADQPSTDEHNTGFHIENLPPKNDAVAFAYAVPNVDASANANANVDGFGVGTQDDSNGADMNCISINNANVDGIGAGTQDDSNGPQMNEVLRNNANVVNDTDPGAQDDSHESQANKIPMRGSPSKLEIIFERTESDDNTGHVGDGRSNSGTEQNEIHNSSGISILEDAAILTPVLPKWRAIERDSTGVNRREAINDPDLEYFASVSMEEDTLELEESVSRKLQQGIDVPRKSFRFSFTKAHEIFRQLDGDLFSPWLSMEDYIRPTRDFITYPVTAPSASTPPASDPSASGPSLYPDQDQKSTKIKAYVVKSRPRRQLSANSTSKSPSFIRFKFGTYVQSLFNPASEPNLKMSLKDVALQRTQMIKARIDKEFEYSDEQVDKKRGRDFMRSVRL